MGVTVQTPSTLFFVILLKLAFEVFYTCQEIAKLVLDRITLRALIVVMFGEARLSILVLGTIAPLITSARASVVTCALRLAART